MKDRPEVYIDLSAIAKGYAVDRVAALLEDEGFAHFMVEIGGEVKTAGSNPDGNGWRIALERPEGNRVVHDEVLTLSGIALATSGDYRNFREIEGERFGHTLDPRTGAPVTHGLAAVTVLHQQAVWADAYATAFMVLGAESGLQVASTLGIAARFVAREGGRTRETVAFARIAARAGGDF
jgi:FAD:protein FMN transferase